MKVAMKAIASTFGLAVLVLQVSASQAATVHTTDFIPNNSRTHFNGFEAITYDDVAGYNVLTYIEGGIRVEQVNSRITGYIPDVATTFMTPGFEGGRSWYSNGDYGYTAVNMADGSDFDRVGFLRGSGWVSVDDPDRFHSSLHYELWNDGVQVQSGLLGPYTYLSSYVGFSGGGFDEIRLCDTLYSVVSSCGDGSYQPGNWMNNALAVDSIETAAAVPEPTIWALFGAGALVVIGLRRRAAVQNVA